MNVDGMGRDYSILHAAICACNLPIESRIMREVHGDGAVGDSAALLVSIEYSMRIMLWRMSGCQGRPPKPLIGGEGGNEGYHSMEIEELDEFLSRSRTED